MKGPSKARKKVSAAVDVDREEFAAKVRGARAILGWSQIKLGQKAGLAQRSIYRLEMGIVDVRKSTAVALEAVFGDAGVHFEPVPSGGFRIVVSRRLSGTNRRRATSTRKTS
jgi:DNA-binding XRE family transcriptional regulator